MPAHKLNPPVVVPTVFVDPITTRGFGIHRCINHHLRSYSVLLADVVSGTKNGFVRIKYSEGSNGTMCTKPLSSTRVSSNLIADTNFDIPIRADSQNEDRFFSGSGVRVGRLLRLGWDEEG